MKKPSFSSRRNPEGLAVFPRTLSVEELGRIKVPGQVSWLSGHRLLLGLPFPQGQKSGCPLADGLRGSGLPITVAGPLPIYTAFPFSPEDPGHHGNQNCQRTTKT
jgi:hypothetical protein